MARKRMVTRTITVTTAEVVCADTEAKTMSNEIFQIPGKFKTQELLLKAVEQFVGQGRIKPVLVINSEETQTRYGMTEQEFLLHAVVLSEEEAEE